jgi:hypothetical protein
MAAIGLKTRKTAWESRFSGGNCWVFVLSTFFMQVPVSTVQQKRFGCQRFLYYFFKESLNDAIWPNGQCRDRAHGA